MVRAAGLTCSLAAFLFACPEQKAALPTPGAGEAPLASVDGQAISREEFERELTQEINSGAGIAGAPVDLKSLKRAVLDGMINRLLLLQAAREANISVASDDVDREVLRLRAEYAGDRFNEVMAEGQLSLSDLKSKTAALLTIQKLFREQVYSRIAVTEEEIAAYYEQHSADFQQPDEVRAAQIVVRTAEEARSIEQQIRAGKDFGEMARMYSLSPDAKSGGDLGFFPRGQMPRQFDQVVFRLKVKQVSGVVRTDYGFHLFKVLARRAARQKPLHEVKGQIEQKLASDKREQAQAEYVKMLKGKAVVRVNEPALAAAHAVPRARALNGAE